MLPVQYFSEEYLNECEKIPLIERLAFLDEFAQLNYPAHAETYEAQQATLAKYFNVTVNKTLK